MIDADEIISDLSFNEIYNNYHTASILYEQYLKDVSDLKDRLLNNEEKLSFDNLENIYNVICNKSETEMENFFDNYPLYKEYCEKTFLLSKINEYKKILIDSVDFSALNNSVFYENDYKLVSVDEKISFDLTSDIMYFLKYCLDQKGYYIGKVTEEEISLIKLVDYNIKKEKFNYLCSLNDISKDDREFLLGEYEEVFFNSTDIAFIYKVELERARNIENLNTKYLDDKEKELLIANVNLKLKKLKKYKPELSDILKEKYMTEYYEIRVLSEESIEEIYNNTSKNDLKYLASAIDNLDSIDKRNKMKYFRCERDMLNYNYGKTIIKEINEEILKQKKKTL